MTTGGHMAVFCVRIWLRLFIFLSLHPSLIAIKTDSEILHYNLALKQQCILSAKSHETAPSTRQILTLKV